MKIVVTNIPWMSMDYNVIEDMKKNKENVSFFDINNIPQQRDLISQSYKTYLGIPQKTMENFEAKKTCFLVKPNYETRHKAIVNISIIDNQSKSQTVTFLLTF
jgi:hypothetical protein